MSKLGLKKLLEHDVKDLYSAETQLVKALPKMAKAANSPELKEAFESTLKKPRIMLKGSNRLLNYSAANLVARPAKR